MKLAKETANFIKANVDKPFFAYLSFYAVHAPIQTSKQKWLKYQKRAGIKEFWKRDLKWKKAAHKDQARHNPVYAGLVEQTDEAVGHVLNTLDALNLDDNTVIVFVSDNGGVSAGDDYATSNLP